MRENPSPAIYRRFFGSDEGQLIFADLMEFVKLWNNGFDADPRRAERVAGMEDVLMFIIERCGIEISEQYLEIARALFTVPALKPEPQPEEAETEP